MKVALVTGASKGIGKACALRLARDGYTVVVNYSSSDEAAQQTLDQIKAEGGDGMIYKALASMPVSSKGTVAVPLPSFKSALSTPAEGSTTSM